MSVDFPARAAFRVTLKRQGERRRRLIVTGIGVRPKSGDTIRIGGKPWTVTAAEPTEIIAEFKIEGKRLKQVNP